MLTVSLRIPDTLVYITPVTYGYACYTAVSGARLIEKIYHHYTAQQTMWRREWDIVILLVLCFVVFLLICKYQRMFVMQCVSHRADLPPIHNKRCEDENGVY
jgi:hypothetical protein